MGKREPPLIAEVIIDGINISALVTHSALGISQMCEAGRSPLLVQVLVDGRGRYRARKRDTCISVQQHMRRGVIVPSQ